MAKRHTMRPGDWESVFARIQELVMANSGEDPFEEILKLLVAKLYSEIRKPDATLFAATTPSETADRINRLLAQACQQWRGILDGPPRTNLLDEHLVVCVRAIQDLRLSDTALEVMDGAFEYLISANAKGAKGQYFTPRHVIDCCVRIANPSSNDAVIDPACGSGGFLIHTLNHVRSREPGLDVTRYCQEKLWGCDFDRRAVQVAKAMMLITGDGQSNIFRLNSLLTPEANSLLLGEETTDEWPRLTIEDVLRARSRQFKGFDVVLTNPPFAGEIREPQILENYQLSRKGRRVERDVLFLERCVRLLRPGGRLGIVLPHNKLGAASWDYLRQWLLKNVRVVAVLGLGRSTFLPHTHQKTSVVFGVKREKPVRSADAERILFLISEKDGKDSRGQIIPRPGTTEEDPAWMRADHDLDELAARFHEFVKESGVEWS